MSFEPAYPYGFGWDDRITRARMCATEEYCLAAIGDFCRSAIADGRVLRVRRLGCCIG